jgi:transcriptional regulator with XRE-family HTH domain
MDTVEDKFAHSRKILSSNLKRIRIDKSLSQEKLALEAGVDRTVVSKIEREVANPSFEILIRLALTLGVSVSALFD